MQKFFWFLIVSFLLSCSLVSSVNVSITSEVRDSTIFFTYDFNFNDRDGLSSFAFEKPKNSRFISAISSTGESIRPSVAGDFFIFEPEETKGHNITISFESSTLYSNLEQTGTFSTYVTFNFEPTQVKFRYKPNSQYAQKEIFEIFPRDYIILEDNQIEWTILNLSSDQLFLISYNQDSSSSGVTENIFLFLLLIPVAFFIILLVFLKLSSQKEDIKEKKVSSTSTSSDDIEKKSSITQESEKSLTRDKVKHDSQKLDSSQNDSNVTPRKDEKGDVENKSAIKEVTKEELFEDFISKYLTFNEQEVVRVVQNHEGIAQNDILHHLTSLTKSNLSKIISKLHGKKVLNRIRVGKINKIYLGDKLKFDDDSIKVEKSDE